MTATKSWPNFPFREGAEVDNQVAAPAETRTPSALFGRKATGAARLNGNRFTEEAQKTLLTRTGLLMKDLRVLLLVSYPLLQ